MLIKRKILSRLIGLVVILISLVIVFLVNYFNKDLYIMNGKLVFNDYGWETRKREDCIQVSRYIERYIHDKYNITNITISQISLLPPVTFNGNYGFAGPVYTISIRFEDNNYIESLGAIGEYPNFNINALKTRFKPVSRDKCVEFSEKIEELVKIKYNEELKIKSVLPVDTKKYEKSDFYYKIYFENDYVAEITATNKKLFDIKSISLDESIVFK